MPRRTDVSLRRSTMKITSLATTCAAVLGLALVQPAIAQSRAPTDTGNMAYPAPLPTGVYGTSAATGSNRPTDTGNMAYPSRWPLASPAPPRPRGRTGRPISATWPTRPRRPAALPAAAPRGGRPHRRRNGRGAPLGRALALALARVRSLSGPSDRLRSIEVARFRGRRGPSCLRDCRCRRGP